MIKQTNRCILILGFISLLLLGCGLREGLAPVEESKGYKQNNSTQRHTVRRGETLYAIAFQHDQDYHYLATLNRLNSPYTLRVGQVIKLNPNARKAGPPMLSSPLARSLSSSHTQWRWPIIGHIKTSFSPQKGQKGIDIAGKKGQKIHASAAGIVAYAGNGLAGYGNLIILKHDNQYLTAYGNNQRNLVREGQTIKQGAVIAEVGVVNRQFWGVHFEIRKLGEPVNPLSYLHKKA
ncbi:MAG: peptidoglycan DD-metalloendopeptidase family protein [Gammaproteobacteria bacterium]|nr:peptidoglycan DD-metalloendopeptidase family protein [Gammaproteobacteria bacterium]MCH9717613.1 peptidoglycan DD-metalloendopeptidase family protein [Gammaproteobacteria bacterium]MCH9762634.1 peptidoglycan DD-metalloendopeptidase family protein [Gammaproteobacteria bacterium]